MYWLVFGRAGATRAAQVLNVLAARVAPALLFLPYFPRTAATQSRYQYALSFHIRCWLG